MVLYVECLGKESILNEEGQTDSLEETASVLSRSFVSWIGPVLKEGYRLVLVNERLPSVDDELKSGPLRASILRTLSNYCEFRLWMHSGIMCVNSSSASSPLALVLLRCLRAPFLTVIVPRLFVIVFRYGQPVLIRYAIEYVQSPETNEDRGHLLVFVAAIVYTGLAVGHLLFSYQCN